MPVTANCKDMTSYVTFVLPSDKCAKHRLFDSIHIVFLTDKLCRNRLLCILNRVGA
jgi:hypothetical protein